MKTTIKTLLFATLLAAGSSGLAATSTAPEQSIAGLQQALNSRDFRALASMYTDGAVIIPAESEILHSPDAINGFWKDQLVSGANSYRFDVIDSDVHGDHAYVSTLWTAKVHTRDDRLVTFQGNISHVLDRQPDGSWKISMQSWN